MSTILEKMKEDKDIRVIKLEVNTDQKSAMKLYKYFGFKEIDTIPLILGDGNKHQVTNMEKVVPEN
jgi:ribosomal protein S18 acetylase RimI-like enzyme